MHLYPIEQIPDQGNAQRTKSLRLKRELHWIKTLGTQIPPRMNHKITRKRDIFVTFPFSTNATKAFKTRRVDGNADILSHAGPYQYPPLRGHIAVVF